LTFALENSRIIALTIETIHLHEIGHQSGILAWIQIRYSTLRTATPPGEWDSERSDSELASLSTIVNNMRIENRWKPSIFTAIFTEGRRRATIAATDHGKKSSAGMSGKE
jgi:hypothetical protein